MYSPEGANPYIRKPIRVIVHIDHVLAGGIGPGQPRLAVQDHARNRMPHAWYAPCRGGGGGSRRLECITTQKLVHELRRIHIPRSSVNKEPRPRDLPRV